MTALRRAAAPVADMLWERICREAQTAAAADPVLATLVHAAVLSRTGIEDALALRLCRRIVPAGGEAGSLRQTALAAYDDPLGPAAGMRADFDAAIERAGSARRCLDTLLHAKGFHALQLHRIGHWLWTKGRREAALYLQALGSSELQSDIHPAAVIGSGAFLDAATGLVVGSTARVGRDAVLHKGVTLGGNGTAAGVRHPRLGHGVEIGPGARLVGPIAVGDGARIEAGAFVTSDVPPGSVFAGVPARDVTRRQPRAARG